jgi:hypothetical protein
MSRRNLLVPESSFQLFCILAILFNFEHFEYNRISLLFIYIILKYIGVEHLFVCLCHLHWWIFSNILLIFIGLFLYWILRIFIYYRYKIFIRYMFWHFFSTLWLYFHSLNDVFQTENNWSFIYHFFPLKIMFWRH